ncbi:MAG: hypothetical protein UIH18_03480 [Fibrobacteraceae bacterium]|nr:hypothetical protein [Fibrobacteraceae bacterium]
MNPDKMKKFKILLAIDIVIIVALAVVMFVLKGQYGEMAQKLATEQRDAYRKQANDILHEQWKSVDQFGMAWRLVFETVSSKDKSEKSFDARLKAIENDKPARERQVQHLYSAAGIPEKAQLQFSELGYAEGSILLKDEKGVKEVACGKDCKISFTFVKGNLKSLDYSALEKYVPAEHFKLAEPAPFRFE